MLLRPWQHYYTKPNKHNRQSSNWHNFHNTLFRPSFLFPPLLLSLVGPPGRFFIFFFLKTKKSYNKILFRKKWNFKIKKCGKHVLLYRWLFLRLLALYCFWWVTDVKYVLLLQLHLFQLTLLQSLHYAFHIAFTNIIVPVTKYYLNPHKNDFLFCLNDYDRIFYNGNYCQYYFSLYHIVQIYWQLSWMLYCNCGFASTKSCTHCFCLLPHVLS